MRGRDATAVVRNRLSDGKTNHGVKGAQDRRKAVMMDEVNCGLNHACVA